MTAMQVELFRALCKALPKMAALRSLELIDLQQALGKVKLRNTRYSIRHLAP